MGENDGFTPRNAHTAVGFSANKVLIFGGQDSQNDRQFNDLYTIDLEANTLTQHEYSDGAVTPAARNSHTLTKHGDSKAYLFGGANADGPRKDLFELDLNTLAFKTV